MPRLKVFCTTSGFHDHVVAAPSRPAALKAWGAKTDLFSMGVARQVTDPKIEKKALDRPGEVIRLKRSGGGEEVAAPEEEGKAQSKPPSRSKLQAAEKKLADLTARQAKEREAIERELKALEKKRDQLAARHAKARATAEEKVEQAREALRRLALAGWDELAAGKLLELVLAPPADHQPAPRAWRTARRNSRTGSRNRRRRRRSLPCRG